MDLILFPTSPNEFKAIFPDNAACAKYLESLRWPKGFTCPNCGLHGEPYRFKTRSSVVLRCRRCQVSTSLTAGTVMRSSRVPLIVWFRAAYLTTTNPNQPIVQFQRQLRLKHYQTAHRMAKLLRAR
jgi:hypothetical protein